MTDQQPSSAPSKRTRTDAVSSSSLHINNDGDSHLRIQAPVTVPYSTRLIQGHKSYLLRWFARRHRHILSIVFTSHDFSLLYPKLEIISKLMKDFLKKKYKSTDRTIARIDRRIFFGKYNLDTGDTKLEYALEKVLQFRK